MLCIGSRFLSVVFDANQEYLDATGEMLISVNSNDLWHDTMESAIQFISLASLKARLAGISLTKVEHIENVGREMISDMLRINPGRYVICDIIPKRMFPISLNGQRNISPGDHFAWETRPSESQGEIKTEKVVIRGNRIIADQTKIIHSVSIIDMADDPAFSNMLNIANQAEVLRVIIQGEKREFIYDTTPWKIKIRQEKDSGRYLYEVLRNIFDSAPS